MRVKNIEVEFLKVSEKNWSPGLPDIGAWKSWDSLILTVSASTEHLLQLPDNKDCVCSASKKKVMYSKKKEFVPLRDLL